MSTEDKTKGKKGNRGYYTKSKKQEPSAESKAEEKKEEKTQEKEATKVETKTEVKKGPPPARHLATKQTPLKNDPIYLESFVVDGDRGFIPAPRAKFFSPSCDSFLPLVHADYTNLVAANRSFGKVVSQSTYAYYNIMHLWARLYAIMRHRRELTPIVLSFSDGYQPRRLAVGISRCVKTGPSLRSATSPVGTCPGTGGGPPPSDCCSSTSASSGCSPETSSSPSLTSVLGRGTTTTSPLAATAF